MSEYLYRTTRREWCVVLCEVDQYGIHDREKSETLSVWPSFEEARAALSNHGKPHEYVRSRWIPNGASHDYCELRVESREYLVRQWFAHYANL